MYTQTIRLLMTCRDARGIVAAVTGFVAEHDGNILELDQHTDKDHGEFFMRLEIESGGFGLEPASFVPAWRPLCEKFGMRWWVYWGDHVKRMAILATREGHCLADLLWRCRSSELHAGVPLVISNHPDLGPSVEALGAAGHHLPVTDCDERPRQEQRILALLREHRVDFVVLARYMQVLSPEFVAAWPEKIINIHHSFLPAFAGSRPYHQAYERGVKIIGATSHYVTADLDRGPIIAQDTCAVDHRDTVQDLIRKGRDLERLTLAAAVRLHVEDKILVSQNKTVVFD
jgi:formyltetrahydrofolate deformylase